MRDFIADILGGEFNILMAATGTEGIDMASNKGPDLVLLDINMPDMDGYEVLRVLRENPKTVPMPVIFVTGCHEAETETRGLTLGAVDYVTKPINAAVVRARVSNQMRLRRAETELLSLAAKQHFDEMAAEMERCAAAERNRELQLKMKDEFLSHVSHELRSPLAAICAFLSLITDGHAGEVTEDQDKYIGIALRNAAHLQSMVEDILQATRLGTGKLSIEAGAVDILEIIEYAMHTLQGAAGNKSIVLSREVESGLRSVHGDPVRLRQILTILLDNAVKFTPEGGSIRVEATPVGPKADFLLAAVCDSGCGIRPEATASVFERLYQVEAPQLGSRGLGLGLHIAKELVEPRPAIVIISAYERDTILKEATDLVFDGFLVKPFEETKLLETVTSALSLKAAPTAQPLSSIDPSDLNGRHVLLVEDNELNRDLAIELLGDLGIQVTIALDGREAVDLINAQHFDLVLMDIQMPIMDGLTATKTIRANVRYRDLPIIAMTAHAMSGDRERSLAAGMDDHINKPIDPDGFTQTLVRWLSSGTGTPARRSTLSSTSGPDEMRLPDQLPPFNLPAALLRTNGKPLLLRNLLIGFRRQYENMIEELKTDLNDGRPEEAQRLVHSLKSIAAMLEVSNLVGAAAALEDSMRKGQHDALPGLIDTLDAALRPAIAAVAILDEKVNQPSDAQLSMVLPPAPIVEAQKKRAAILAVDDQLAVLDLIGSTFGDDYQVLTARQGDEALALAQLHSPEVVLLDIDMPGLNGFDVCRQLKSDARTRDIPVIFITGMDDSHSEALGLSLGAVDYVAKPLDPSVIRVRVENQLKLKKAEINLLRLLAKRYLDDMVDDLERSLLRQRTKELELKIKDGFSSHVSHELRSPLTSIYSFVSLLADRLVGEINEEQEEYLGIVLDNTEQLKRMVENLLEDNRIRTDLIDLHTENIAVDEALRQVVAQLQQGANAKRIKLSLEVPESVSTALADPVRLHQCLLILIENALKFTNPGGTVALSVKIFETDPRFLVFEVSDNGCGISPELTDSIFEKLNHIDSSDRMGRVGLGLSLHIAKELVRRQGGEIWVKSALGEGSSFFFTIPVRMKRRMAA